MEPSEHSHQAPSVLQKQYGMQGQLRVARLAARGRRAPA